MTDDDGKMWDVAAASIIFGMAARECRDAILALIDKEPK